MDRVRERDREIHTSTNTLYEHEFERGDRARTENFHAVSNHQIRRTT